ncbi:MAG: hypothetical protein R3345_15260, partial [Fulvivirga sp.]|nr:hypothetical protein [Fulvivirga sp.]
KDEQIVALKTNLEELNIEKEALAANVEQLTTTVDTLANKTQLQAAVIEVQNETIDEQKEKINTGYIAVGTYKELEEQKVVEKAGGVLGIGATKTLQDNFNEEAFQKVDVTELSAIPVTAKKVRLVTTHPEGSYELSKDLNEKIQQLTILNPDEFWKSSKYLVVMVE